ncbi:PEP-CTERM sorting domain-containing protein [Luteolibacter sp. Populi]|uniref:PEP-CTERM sorting domain-containing protein n=1 Tax=Luteolibacter sp. Populi TaxID=3230487 RepID=UPI0034657763
MKSLSPLSVLVFLLSSGAASQAALIATHTGSNDPTTEGWLLSDSTAIAGPITGDFGQSAWSVDSSGGNYNHRFSLDPAAEADANTNGWLLNLNLRLVDIPDAMDFGVYADYATNSGIFQIGFGTQADGDPIIGLNTDSGFITYAFEGGGAGYHNYQIAFNPAISAATLSIDGTLRLSGWTGRVGPAPTILNFGSFAAGHANWNEFTFSSVPEPSVGILAGIACGLGLSRRRRGTC